MEQITKRLQEILQHEVKKNVNNKELREFDELVRTLEKSGITKKADYTLPLADTIGRRYYYSLSKRNTI